MFAIYNSQRFKKKDNNLPKPYPPIKKGLKILRIPILCLMMILPYVSLAQQTMQSLKAIETAVHSFVLKQLDHPNKDHIEITVNKLNHRLKLAACKTPLTLYLPTNQPIQTRASVGVKCHEPKPWKLYVPVMVKKYGNVVVTSRSLTRNTPLTSDHVQIVKKELNRYRRGYYQTIEEIVGLITLRPVRANSVLTPTMLKPAYLVKKGASGIKGQVINVKNLSSKKIIQVVIIQAGQVAVRI